MTFATNPKPSASAGDRSFITTPDNKKKKTIESDIPGFQEELDENGQPTGIYTDGENTYTRTDALRMLAKANGMSPDLTDDELEKMLDEIKNSKNRKTPAYEPQLNRIGV
jgi:hypothetical protein